MLRRASLDSPPHFVLPRDHATAKSRRVDPKGLADVREAECVAVGAVRRNPALGIDIEEAFARAPRHHPLLIDVDRIGQQGQHQALLR